MKVTCKLPHLADVIANSETTFKQQQASHVVRQYFDQQSSDHTVISLNGAFLPFNICMCKLFTTQYPAPGQTNRPPSRLSCANVRTCTRSSSWSIDARQQQSIDDCAVMALIGGFKLKP